MKTIKEEIITIRRKESNFDRACEEAHRYALSILDIDEAGYANNVIGWNRSNCTLEIEFRKYIMICSMAGSTHEYSFVVRAQKYEDDE